MRRTSQDTWLIKDRRSWGLGIPFNQCPGIFSSMHACIHAYILHAQYVCSGMLMVCVLCMHVCMLHIFVSVHICVCLPVCLYAHSHMYVHCIFVCMHAPMCLPVCVYACILMCTCSCVYLLMCYAYACMSMHVLISIHMYACVWRGQGRSCAQYFLQGSKPHGEACVCFQAEV